MVLKQKNIAFVTTKRIIMYKRFGSEKKRIRKCQRGGDEKDDFLQTWMKQINGWGREQTHTSA